MQKVYVNLSDTVIHKKNLYVKIIPSTYCEAVEIELSNTEIKKRIEHFWDQDWFYLGKTNHKPCCNSQ